jgi:hypothetical protein
MSVFLWDGCLSANNHGMGASSSSSPPTVSNRRECSQCGGTARTVFAQGTLLDPDGWASPGFPGLPRTSLQLGSAKEDANSHRPPHYAHMLQRSRLAPSLRLLLGSSSSPIERSIVSRRSLTQGFFAAGLSTRPGCPRGRALPRSRSCTTRAVERLYK